MRAIRFHITKSGHCPVEEFLDSQPSKAAQKILWVLKLVEELDQEPTHYFEKLTGTKDLWEIRIQIGSNEFRILGFFVGKNILILNHAFKKKSQKIPVKHMKLAESRKRDYLDLN